MLLCDACWMHAGLCMAPQFALACQGSCTHSVGWCNASTSDVRRRIVHASLVATSDTLASLDTHSMACRGCCVACTGCMPLPLLCAIPLIGCITYIV